MMYFRALVKELKPRKVIVGFRPEDTRISPLEYDGYRKLCFQDEVYAVEPLGKENIITVAIDDNVVKVIVPQDKTFNIGEKVKVYPIEEKVVLFDVAAEKALETIV